MAQEGMAANSILKFQYKILTLIQLGPLDLHSQYLYYLS